MKIKLTLLSVVGALLLAGCSNNQLETPKKEINKMEQSKIKKRLSDFKVDKTNPKSLSITFTNLFNTAKYFRANSLMCSPDTNNNLVYKMEDIYADTLAKDKTMTDKIKGMMLEDPNFKYLIKYDSYMDMTVEDKQHFLFSYVKVYAKMKFKDYLQHFRYVKTEEKILDEDTKIYENTFKKQDNYKMQTVEMYNKGTEWCVHSFK